ncbi:hypothetical protein RN001_000952 [Aquatica leii]|uniref:Armadillo repeat-containing protein 6 n=1 Tax=Aquatica leii TaxID=1421715 RepID=A0AAN7PKQ3_9COLE|nr:hypothetical protein RN001_000952 [Aquatica leii]
MVLKINQETFDDAVKENITEFGMEIGEAIADAVKQYEAQGVDLSNIIKDHMTSLDTESTQELAEALAKLAKFAKSEVSTSVPQILQLLQVVTNECDKGIPNRVYAGKQGAYNIIMDLALKYCLNAEMLVNCFTALKSLMTKQPDLLNESGIQCIGKCLHQQTNPEVLSALLKWVKECCIMHETNRQSIFNAGILEDLKPLLQKVDVSLLRDVLGVLRALVLDDDVRVEFGRSHEHARAIASDTLCSITALLSNFKNDELLINDLLLTISSLLVRTEFCKKVEDAGGLDVIRDTMVVFQSRDKFVRQCFKVLKALAGNDEVKVLIIKKDLAPIITSALSIHKSSSQTATLGLGCIAALTLRCPDNSKALFEAGAPEVIVDCMKLHSDDVNVQKNASWAIRNMVSRSRYQSNKFLEIGVEPILKSNLKKFTHHEFDAKSALRDLGCEVNLKEEWTGSGGLLTTQGKRK